ncbi:MAG: hypothetical protein IKF78_00070 [Atopobiaceae bacterium]|nr:hypothetical protein [Atopobiaceae bacterium]
MNKSEILFNRALLWVVLLHLTDNKVAATMFTVCSLLNIIDSVICMVRKDDE